MKVIGMYFIIAGHIFPLGHEYIYVFSVPLFFVISGYLGHRENNDRLFWEKLCTNLILPCIVICLILHLEMIASQIRIGVFGWNLVPKHIIQCIIGSLNLHTLEGGIGICWFIYTLVLCKIIQQYLSHFKLANVAIIVLCAVISIWYNINNLHYCNSIMNVTLAYPMYAIGGGINVEKILSAKVFVHIFAFAVYVLIVIIVGWYNGAPWMYDATYGKNIVLFFVGGLSGTMAVLIVSYHLKKFKPSWLLVISRGTIIILGFHQLFIRAYSYLPDMFHNVLVDYIMALVILFAFVPIIQLSERYFPVLLGSRAQNITKK